MLRISPLQGMALLLLAVAAYFPLFLHLDSFPIMMWDESRFALNAWEMTQNGNPLVTYYEGEPDFWNSKPPLTAALQALSMRLLGYTELAVRLPSALAGLFTLLVLLVFSWKVLRSPAVGYLAVLALLCSAGYIKVHVVRTGDADGLLVAWTTLYALAYFLYLERPQRRWLLLMGGALVLGVYTKGVAALLPVPGLLLYALVSGKARLAFLRPGLYVMAAGVLLFGVAYYLLRESLTPGYIEAVALNEWGGRFFREANTGQAVNEDVWFYLRSIWKVPNLPFLLLLPLLAGLGLASKTALLRRATLMGVLFAGTLLILLSLSRTKHFWYDAPIYPLLALLYGIGLREAYLRAKQWITAPYLSLTATALVLLLFGPPYLKVVQRVVNRDLISHWEAEGAFIRQIQEQLPGITRYTVLKKVQHPFHYAQIYYYQKAYGHRFGTEITVSDSSDALAGEVLLCCQKDLLDSVRLRYSPETLSRWRNCYLLKVPEQP